MRTLTWPEVCGRRLRRGYLVTPAAPGEYAAAASAMCGVQAQALEAAEWGIGLRVSGATQAGVRAAFWEQRRLVRTYGLRSTVHVFPAAELPLWMAAMRVHAELTGDRWYERAGLDREQGNALVAAIGEALRGRSLTREQLAEEVAALTGEWARPILRSSWGEALAPAAFAGLLCFAEHQSGRSVYVRPDDWTGGWQEVEPRAALREICRRYIRTYGPVTHQDLARWLRVKASQAQALLAGLGDEVVQVGVETQEGGRGSIQRAWVLAEDADTDWEPARQTVRLLPRYDAYVIAAGQRELMQPPDIKAWLTSPALNRFEGATGLRVVLVDGVIAGTWDRIEGRAGSIVRVTPYRRLGDAVRVSLEDEAARVGGYHGGEATLEVAPPAVDS